MEFHCIKQILYIMVSATESSFCNLTIEIIFHGTVGLFVFQYTGIQKNAFVYFSGKNTKNIK